MKVGRNDPCPCGSGRKHKNCHGASTTAEQRSAPKGSRVDPLEAERRFERFVEAINDRLREADTPIQDRPSAAVAAAAQMTWTVLRSDVPDRDPTPGVYSGDDLVIRIRRWYTARYSTALEPAPRIDSEDEFLSQMDAIDERLRTQGVSITGRPIVAIGEFSKLLHEELRGYPLDREPVPGRYTGDDLVIRIDRWYRDRYGDRLLMDSKNGRVVIILRGDPWVMDLPLIFGGGGGLRFVCEYGRPTTLPSTPRVYRRGERPQASEYNVLDAIVGLTDGLAKTITKAECDEILQVFLWGREAYEALRHSTRSGLVELVEGDLEAAVVHLSGHYQPGLSKWASLQAAEKIVKAYIKETSGGHKFGHDLTDQASQAASAGLPIIDPALIQDIQCPAGVRYGQPSVSVAEAVAAHHASLRVVAHVVPHLPRRRPLSQGGRA